MSEKQLNFRIEGDLLHDLKILAAKSNKSHPDIIRRLISNYVDKHLKNNQYTLEEFETQEAPRTPSFMASSLDFSTFFSGLTEIQFKEYVEQVKMIERQLLTQAKLASI